MRACVRARSHSGFLGKEALIGEAGGWEVRVLGSVGGAPGARVFGAGCGWRAGAAGR